MSQGACVFVLIVAMSVFLHEIVGFNSKPNAKVGAPYTPSFLSASGGEGNDNGERPSSSSSSNGDSSNLITLLNFAQEVGASSSSEKLRASADRLRQQFVKSFATRYDLSTGPLAGGTTVASGSLPTLLANINDDSLLSEEAKAIRDVILMQLNEVGGEAAAKPENIIFYNEKLKHLREYRYALPFPRDALQPVSLVDKLAPSRDARNGNNNGVASMSGSDIMTAIKEKRLREEQEKKQAASKLEAKTEPDATAEGQPRARKRDVLFNGLRAIGSVFTGRGNNNGDESTMDVESSEDGGDDGGASDEEKEAMVQGFLEADADATSAASSAATRQQQVTAATIEQTLRRAKKRRLENNPSLLEQQRRDVEVLKSALSEEVGRWRVEATRVMGDAIGLTGELVVPPQRSYAISKPVSAQSVTATGAASSSSSSLASESDAEAPSYASWRASVEVIGSARTIFPVPRRLSYDTLPPTAFVVQRSGAGAVEEAGGGQIRTELATDSHPNYIALLHTCLTASLATYNLELSSVFEGMESYLDQGMSHMRIQMREYQRQLDEEDFGFLTSLSTQTASVIQEVLEMDTTNDNDVQSRRENELGLKRARVLSRMAVGRVSELAVERMIQERGSAAPAVTDSSLEGVQVETVCSEKACGIVTTDSQQGVTVVAFRGTLDPMDVVTDISFVSAPFKAINDRVVSDFRASETLIPEYDSIEVHGGFLQSFDSLLEQVQARLGEVAAEVKLASASASASSGGSGGDTALKKHTLLFTGHSMGGALAQLAAAYFCEHEDFAALFDTNLVTIAAPATGNADFVKYLNSHAGPYGGIRFWNEYDPVPYLATVVGYELGGIPVKVPLGKGARGKFKRTTRNPFAVAGGLDGVMPHVLYQLGTLVYAFPVLGHDINDSDSSSEASRGSASGASASAGAGVATVGGGSNQESSA